MVELLCRARQLLKAPGVIVGVYITITGTFCYWEVEVIMSLMEGNWHQNWSQATKPRNSTASRVVIREVKKQKEKDVNGKIKGKHVALS